MTADLREQLQASLGAAYTLERELGGGGMSRVFVAHEARLGRRVVVKFLDPGLAPALSAERFEREMRVAARLQDPRIVPVLSAGDANGIPFYTMPFVAGESLHTRIARGRVPVAEAIAILRDVALALQSAHASGVVHRDIKPGNILLAGGTPSDGTTGTADRREVTAVVTDFGIAKAISAALGGERPEGDRARDVASRTLTQAGVSLGTPAYMAPEQAFGDTAVDTRADLYAWGVVAYELLAGVHPFGQRDDAQAMVAAHVTAVPEPLASRNPSVPREVAELVDRALRKNAAERPPNAAAIVRALTTVALGAGGSAPPAGDTRHLSRRLIAAGAVAVVAAGAAIAAVSWSRADSSPDSAATAVRSIAVMPFTTGTADTAIAYLGDGMADALTAALARLSELRVVANRSAIAARGVRYDPRDAGRALKVDAVLTGTVGQLGNQLRIRAQLTRVADGTVLWGDAYDRAALNTFELEDDVTATIAAALRGTLSGQRVAAAAHDLRGTTSRAAYDLYLKGRYAWSKRGERGLRTAIELFDAAIARDENFARAHAGLAMAWVVLPVFTTSVSADSGIAMAQRSGSRALALDSSLADAHLAIAYANKMKWRWQDAERHFRIAAALAPEDAGVFHWYGVHLNAVGNIERSLGEFQRARELDPFATTVATDGAIGFYAARQFSKARTEIGRSLMLDSTRSDTWLVLGIIQLAQAHADSAVMAFERARQLGTGFDMRSYLSAAWRRVGRVRQADDAYAELRRDYEAGRALPYDIAIAATAAGDRAAAMRAVQRLVEQRDMLVTEVSMPCDPLFDGLRSDPRFEQLLAGAGMQCHVPLEKQ